MQLYNIAFCLLFILPLAFCGSDEELVVCPDKISACPDGTTCCPLGEGTYGCCPIPNAVCCKDQRHCCPHDSVCDTAEGQCTQRLTGRRLPLHKKTPARRLYSDESDSVEDDIPVVWKPNSEATEDSMKLHSPRQNAALSGDDDSVQMESQFPRQNASPRRQIFRETSSNKDVECSDGKSKCPSGTTCCALDGGLFGCCPIPNAVCCEDHLHCCPQGTHCDVSEGRCANRLNDETTPWYRKFSATKVVRKSGVSFKPSSRPCNGGICRGDESCCESASIRAIPECCRFLEGVCCNDGTCCPKGYKCHRDGCKVDSFEITVTAPAAPIRRGKYTFDDSSESDSETISCPDNSECPAGNTCCPMDKDRVEIPTSYQCCPLAHATCCNSACCPRGFHCVDGNYCEKSALTKELLREILFN
jgi:hypothetical protein